MRIQYIIKMRMKMSEVTQAKMMILQMEVKMRMKLRNMMKMEKK
jgi:hypothetical protein